MTAGAPETADCRLDPPAGSAPTKGQAKNVIYVVAEHELDAALAILKHKIPKGAKIEPEGPLVGSVLRQLKLARGQFTEV